jgi:hypothetical protein
VEPRAGLQRELLLSRESNDDRSFGSSYPVSVRLFLCRRSVDSLPALVTVIGMPIDEGSSPRRKTTMYVVRKVQERQRKVILARTGEVQSAEHFYEHKLTSERHEVCVCVCVLRRAPAQRLSTQRNARFHKVTVSLI